MCADEFHFHHKRRLPRWERLGHPADTLSLLVPVTMATLVPPEHGALVVYAWLAVFSCVLVTKDEWVHARECEPGEHWVHAMLFILHPLVLLSGALLWRMGGRTFLLIESTSLALWLVYQLLYWGRLEQA